jgi:transposase
MEISSSTLPAVAAERVTMFVALELSKSSWLVALHSPIADKVTCIGLSVATSPGYWR